MKPENPNTNPTKLYEPENIPLQTDDHLTTNGITITDHSGEEVDIHPGDVISFEYDNGRPITYNYILELKTNWAIIYSLTGESYDQITHKSISDNIELSIQYTIFKDPYDRRAKAQFRDGIPEYETVERNRHVWELTEYDTGCYHWIRELNEDEYDWDPEKDDVSIVGFDKPCRTVDIRLENGEFSIVGNETAGPNYHRPGYTEPISNEYSETADTTEEALEKALNMIERLS